MASKSLFAPPGKCLWAHVFKPQDPIEAGKSREWGITLVLDPQEHKTIDFLTILDDLFKELNGSAKVARDGLPYKEQTAKDGTPTGMVEIKFKRKETSNKGNIIPAPLVIDSKRQPFPSDKQLGNGSLVKVKFSYYGWEAVTGTGRGLSLWLEAVQVLDFVPYEGADLGEGFEDEEGYVLETGAEGFESEGAPAPQAAAPAPAPQTLAERLKARAQEVQDESSADSELPF